MTKRTRPTNQSSGVYLNPPYDLGCPWGIVGEGGQSAVISSEVAYHLESAGIPLSKGYGVVSEASSGALERARELAPQLKLSKKALRILGVK